MSALLGKFCKQSETWKSHLAVEFPTGKSEVTCDSVDNKIMLCMWMARARLVILWYHWAKECAYFDYFLLQSTTSFDIWELIWNCSWGPFDIFPWLWSDVWQRLDWEEQIAAKSERQRHVMQAIIILPVPRKNVKSYSATYFTEITVMQAEQNLSCSSICCWNSTVCAAVTDIGGIWKSHWLHLIFILMNAAS